ncbi:MAG: hypothetical protein BZ138_02695 [Methanosphaera sp. rholeuAM270]|nr:MAG: hypothetical protein BZ138_02695 [Methanosphaera sp. rholeuAM270]
MNICIVGQYPPQLGGVATYTKQLEEKLLEEGHNVYILTYKQNQNPRDNVYMAMGVNIPILRGLLFIVSSYFMLNKITEEHDIDIIHANYILPPGLISVFNKSRAKKIITIHGSDINILPNSKILRPLIKFALNRADSLYFVSEKLKNKAIDICGEKIENKSYVTPNTVDTRKFKPRPENEKRREHDEMITVTFIGNLVEQKGLKYLLKAKEISESEYKLLIYGDGPQKEELKEYIETKNIKDTYLMGKTDTPEKIIPESDIMVLPSVSEGASIVALESMSCEKALVATDTGNITTVITDKENGVIVPTKNPELLSEALDNLVNNEDERTRIGKNARKLIMEKYSKMKIPYIDNNH